MTAVRRIWPLLVLLGLVCILLAPVVFGGRVFLPGGMISKMAPWNASAPDARGVYWNVLQWDSNAHFYPSRTLLGRSLRVGEIPLWNPHQFCGHPLLADVQSAALYPPNWLYAIFPAHMAVGLLAALHLLAAGGFMFIFLRGLKLNRTASLFGGIAFMLSGYAIAWAHLPVFLSVGVWLPLTLHLSRLAHERRSVYYAGGAGLSIGMSLLGGHPQVAFYAMFAAGLYWVYMGITGRRETPVWQSVLLAGTVFAIGLALAAPQLLPTFELAAASHRGVQPPSAEGYAAYTRLAMPLRNLITLLVPDFFGNPAKGNFWGANEYTEFCAYVGILTVLFLPAAFLARDSRKRQAWFFAGMGMLALLLALGTGVNRLFYYGIPGFTKAGSPARILYLFVFSAVVLGSIGFDRVMSSIHEKRSDSKAIVLLPAAGVLVFLVAFFAYNASLVSDLVSAGELLGQLGNEFRIFAAFFIAGLAILHLMSSEKLGRNLGVGLLIAVLAADMLTFGMWYNGVCTKSQAYAPTELTDFLKSDVGHARIMPLNDQWSLREFPKAVLPPDSSTAYGLYDVSGYDSLYPRQYKALLDAAAGMESCPPENGNMVFARNPESPVYDLLGVKWFVSDEPLPGAEKVVENCYLLENKEALPRAFLVHEIEYADESDALDRVVNGKTNLRSMVIIDPKDARRFDPWGDGEPQTIPEELRPDQVEISKYTCNKVEVKVNTAKTGVLVLTDQYFPGWEAYVDGKPVPLARADYCFRAVAVDPGRHTVLFSYEPKPFRRGLGLAWTAIIVLAILGIAGTAKRRSP